MKTDITLAIERALKSYDPAVMCGLTINKFRPRHLITECVVECGSTHAGIIDCLGIAEYFSDVVETRTCAFQDIKDIFSADEMGAPQGCKMGLAPDEPLPTVCTATERCPYQRVNRNGTQSVLFICYEIKVTRADFLSRHGRNFCGNLNYFVMPMDVFRACKNDIPSYIGVIAMLADGSLRRVKECEYSPLNESNQKWLLLSALKRDARERIVRGVRREARKPVSRGVCR